MRACSRFLRNQTPIALLVATAALAGGAQALTPAPAVAATDEGNDCLEAFWILECLNFEDEGGGGQEPATVENPGAATDPVDPVIDPGPGEVILVQGSNPRLLEPQYCPALGGLVDPLDTCPSPQEAKPTLIPGDGCPRHGCAPRLLKKYKKRKFHPWPDEDLPYVISKCLAARRSLDELVWFKDYLVRRGAYDHEYWVSIGNAAEEKAAKATWKELGCGSTLVGT